MARARRALQSTGASGLLLLLAIACAALGCSKRDAQHAGAAPVSSGAAAIASVGSPAPSSSSSAGTGAGSDKPSQCPNQVAGASTAIRDVDGGVELTITAEREADVREIRSRAAYMVEHAKTNTFGGDGTGRCPVVRGPTTIEAADVPGGSRVTVRPKRPDELARLRGEARHRLAKMLGHDDH